MKNAKNLTQQPAEIKGRIFDKLFETLEINQLTGKEMETYHKSVLEYRDVKSAIKYAGEKSFAQGLKHGMEHGIEKEKYEIAKNLLCLNISIDNISMVTGLTSEQINALK